MLKDMHKLVLLMGKGSCLILQIQFSTTIEQIAGLNLESGKNLWMIAPMLSLSGHNILKLFFEKLPQISR